MPSDSILSTVLEASGIIRVIPSIICAIRIALKSTYHELKRMKANCTNKLLFQGRVRSAERTQYWENTPGTVQSYAILHFI